MPLDSRDLTFSPPRAPTAGPEETPGIARIDLPLPGSAATPTSPDIDFDPVAAAADSAFARLATQAALNQALEAARAKAGSTRPAGDWTPELVQSGRALHALLGVDDPLLLNAESSYDDSAMDQQLRDALAQLPHLELASGELAALDAFDLALEEGADVEEALSAAIAAAEAVAEPAWTAPEGEAFLNPPPPFPESEPALAGLDSGLELAGRPAARDTPASGAPRASDSVFDVRLPSLLPADGLAPDADALDPAFGVGFGFGPGFTDDTTLLDFERRLQASTETTRRDLTATAAAASSASEIKGSAAADFLVGTSAADTMGGLADDDYLYGDTPSNYLSGTHDADNPLTSPSFGASGGDDVMSGGAGADSLWGGAGDDQIHGDIPDSGTSLAAEFGFDLGTAGYGDDALWGGEGADSLWGGGGNDTLYGEAGADTLYGGDGNDILDGGDGADRLEGNAGVDTLYGRAGADNLFGYAGDDVIIGGEGDDTLEGGDGADEFRFAGGTGADALAHAQSLGTDTINDYSAADGDSFGLSDADFGFGAAGNLLDGDTYFEVDGGSLSDTAFDASGGDAGPAIVVFGANAGSDGVGLYYTDDASNMSNANSYQIADIIGVNMTDVEAADFFLRS